MNLLQALANDEFRDMANEIKQKVEKQRIEELRKDKEVVWAVETLKKKGFTPEQYEKALKETE